MFTGIVEALGQVRGISKRGMNTLLEINAGNIADDAAVGDSIALDGVCLTVIKNERQVLGFEVIPQTAKVTTLGSLKFGDKVNLERSLRVGDRISGHFVSGHVDCTGLIRKRYQASNSLAFEIGVPTGFMRSFVLRGSIAVDGISLTVAGVKSNTFTVNIIPHSAKNTTLAIRKPSDKVNIEFDLLLKGKIPPL